MMDKQTYLSVEEIIDYLYQDEQRHFLEWDDEQSKHKHIFHDILKVSAWLDEVAKDYEDDEPR